MGLDFSHSRAHWTYSGFSHFRERLGKEIGIELGSMEGFGGERSWDEVEDAIVPLLNHSDCDGHLTALECAMVAPRLRELAGRWPANDDDRVQALRLAQGMEAADREDSCLDFG